MAAEEAEEDSKDGAPATASNKLSHKQFRRLIKKEKRRLKRQEAARLRDKEEEREKWLIENDPVLRAKLDLHEKKREELLIRDEEERKKQNQLWLERETLAQEQFKRRREEEERKAQEKLEQERRIKEEWEEQQRKEKEAEERKQQAIKEKEDVLFRELEKPVDTTKESAWHNPLAPPKSSQNYGTEKDTVNCSFYLKTGACRFAERCSRHHPRPMSSVTLMIPGMFQDARLTQSMLDEADHDTGLEYDEQETTDKFNEFFEDTLEEFKKAGTVVQFKTCCNHEPHLRGNVYVQYKTEEECAQAFVLFNGRWYAGRQLSCEYSPVTKWKSAICGLFERGSCPRGKNCNFMHVYRNPGHAFRHMDYNDHSPGRQESERRRGGRTEDRFGRHSDRSWHHERSREREYSRSRDSERSGRGYSQSRHHRESSERDGQRSRQRTDRSQDREDYRRSYRHERRHSSHGLRRRHSTRERSVERERKNNGDGHKETQEHDRCTQSTNEGEEETKPIKTANQDEESQKPNPNLKRKHHSPKHQKSAKKKHKKHKKHKHKHRSDSSSGEENGVNGES